MGQFYGMNIFLAETSATSGGLDSLLEPIGPIKKAQQLAARAFGAQRTYFVTNGTSTANKIVMQALVEAGRHRAGRPRLPQVAPLRAGACRRPRRSIWTPTRWIEYSMYGAVPLREIKKQLLAFAGRQARPGKVLLLTNCTFDGIVYDVERVMEECLAIKPDLVFLWDEAWFAFARFHPIYRGDRHGDGRQLREKLSGASSIAQEYADFQASFDADDESAWLETRLLPDPDRVRVRVYATQSTHKTLTVAASGLDDPHLRPGFQHEVPEASWRPT